MGPPSAIIRNRMAPTHPITEFLEEARYLNTNVYTGMHTPATADRDGKDWKQMVLKLHASSLSPSYLKVFTDMCNPHLSRQPDSMQVAQEVLRRVIEAATAIRKCLELHDSDTLLDPAHNDPKTWPDNVRFDFTTEAQIVRKPGKALDGKVTENELHFYHQRGRQPWTEDQLLHSRNAKNFFGRTGTLSGIPIGHYVCELIGNCRVRIVDWVVSPQHKMDKRRVPDMMAIDLLTCLTADSPTKERYTGIEYDVEGAHPELAATQAAVAPSWRDRPALF